MTKWIMLNERDTDPEILEIQASRPNNPGAHHDGINVLYTWISPEAETISKEVPDHVSGTMVGVGKHLLTDTDTPVIAPREVFKALYATPEWRLWCGKYEDWEDLQADHEAVFGVGVDGRKSLDTLKEDARSSIAQLIMTAPEEVPPTEE